MEFENEISKTNIYNNYIFIKDWFLLKNEIYKKEFSRAMGDILEVVLLKVNNEMEAFQLFDSQNTRGKELYPHDLLKAYHLRAIETGKQREAISEWEKKRVEDIKELFESYLFPISNWARKEQAIPFTVKEIDYYKGIPKNSNYSYAKRSKAAETNYQITEPFIEGEDFFKMVEHYMKMLDELEGEKNRDNKKYGKENEYRKGKIETDFKNIYDFLEQENGVGYEHTKNLFWCTLMYYYDKFNECGEKVVKKIFLWSFMLRIDMESLGFNSINRYALGKNENGRYTNSISMFSKIAQARLHNEIENIPIKIESKKEIEQANWKWKELFKFMKEGI